ncbi:MAG: ATP-dependent RNA helicase HrpA [Actinomycetota bacterium]|nr:ATP-dependent RNA helicase HrpA [Actinomycetota bacterium]
MAAPDVSELRRRLSELTFRDEHRLDGRLQRLRSLDDAEAREQEFAAFLAELEKADARVAQRRASVPELSYPPQLPVSARRPELLATIGEHQVVVIAGETGSGKTTQLPKICLELGRGIRGTIAHTQPRRLAARTVAERIAEELAVPLGGAVGYSVRFTQKSTADTLLKLMTDGLLLAEIGHDRLLRRYDTIIVDEAHERSLNIDFLLGYLRELLPRRPDLKLVITSATIDPGRFSEHFGGAPVVEVSGRTHPVEVRWTEPAGEDEAEADPVDQVGDAVEELLGEGPGDILVFLSGEREIRDTAEVLNGRLGPRVEVLPLYSRLSVAEQRKAFRPHAHRRVVLATNVAETSVTVPGIRYVVDPGTARISRYSARLKVQRLPIEAVSQASADQRKGRCGREAPGICIRLYSQEDFEARPRFTDPEVQRTNLASVILSMAALGLGEVEDFGFLDPPDRRQVRDGVNLLHELGALDPVVADQSKRLTPLGRRLARLPVDPRLGRMVLEADRLACAEELCIVAAALSIQDPRERPRDLQAQADQSHARFKHESSDFLSYLELWRYLEALQAEVSGNQFRKRCKAEFLHYLRVREWQDLAGQLRSAAEGLGVRMNQSPAEHDAVHVAVLSGLLSHVGLKGSRGREYEGARGSRFAVFPGSSLARAQAKWVMAAELVETSHLFARTVAEIKPGWIEPLAGHLAKRTYSEPRWESRQAAVVATERVTLYGLPVVEGRTVAYARVDPALARALFLRRALVEGNWESPHAFVAENHRRLAEVEQLEQRTRRRDLLVEDDVRMDFFDARVPADVVSGHHLDRWWREARRAEPDLLTYPRGLLLRGGAELDPKARPDVWKQGELRLVLTYRFEPGAPDDGVTAHVPLATLGHLRPVGFDWLVPAFRAELLTALIRGLPKELRKPLVPVPDLVAEILEGVKPRSAPLLELLSAELERRRGVRVPASVWRPDELPVHLRMTFSVEDDQGRVVALGDDLDILRERVRPQLQSELAAAAPELERTREKRWAFGTLPGAVELPGTQGAVRAYPALVDEGETVGVRLLDTPLAQADAMRLGTLRLLTLTTPSPARRIRDRLELATQVALAAAPHGSVASVIADAQRAATEALLREAGGPAWDDAAWRRLRDHVAGSLAERTLAIVDEAVRVLDAAQAVRERLGRPVRPDAQHAVDDVAVQLAGLIGPGFLAATGATRLPDLFRYLVAAAHRLDRVGQNPALDRQRTEELRALEDEHRTRLAAHPPGRPVPEAMREIPWLLEELRVSLFAQGLGSRKAVSGKRIRRVLSGAA